MKDKQECSKLICLIWRLSYHYGMVPCIRLFEDRMEIEFVENDVTKIYNIASHFKILGIVEKSIDYVEGKFVFEYTL